VLFVDVSAVVTTGGFCSLKKHEQEDFDSRNATQNLVRRRHPRHQDMDISVSGYTFGIAHPSKPQLSSRFDSRATHARKPTALTSILSLKFEYKVYARVQVRVRVQDKVGT
jgi:hypothetical protein